MAQRRVAAGKQEKDECCEEAQCHDKEGKEAATVLQPTNSDDEEARRERRIARQHRCIRIAHSKPFKGAVLTIVSATPLFGVAFATPRVLDKIGWSSFPECALPYILGIWLSVQFIYNFASSQWTDPGSTDRVKPTHEVSGQFEMVLPDGQVLYYAPNYCEHCKNWKPPRTHHCSICKKCVLRMDHHCPFTGNCIGMRNHGHFALMYIFAMLGLIYSSILCICAVIAGHLAEDMQAKLAEPSSTKETLKAAGDSWQLHLFLGPGLSGIAAQFIFKVIIYGGVEVGIQMMLTVVALIAVVLFGCQALAMVFSGTTIIEHSFPMKEYVQIQPLEPAGPRSSAVYCPLGPGFYQHRWFENLRDLLGRRWWLRLLLPTPGGVIDIAPAIGPRVSLAGAQALRERIDQVANEGVQKEVASCRELGINPGPRAEDESGAPV
mmetsp:Transcript_1882/g.4788  ORF Transcript_1882/g.4788 Transcript_1882/m.4788 type:complete len:435 (-) Transcript_1882:72-1376(-)